MHDEEFYTEGTNELIELRKKLLMFSIPRSAYRIYYAKASQDASNQIELVKNNEDYLKSHSNFDFTSSQIGDERGCSRGAISPDDSLYAVAGWSGQVTLFNTVNIEPILKLNGHTDKVNSAIFKEENKKSLYSILTTSNDSTVRLWSIVNNTINDSVVFTGHEDKTTYADFHPIGTIIASCSHDKTWRIFDIETKKEILLQEGHSSGVTSLSFQSDGALLCSGDLGGIGLVWDLRSGRNIKNLVGHAKQITKVKFLPNCYQIVSGSADNTIRVWDLRKENCLHTLPAHNDIISDIQVKNDKFALSCSFDSNIKMWNIGKNWNLINSFKLNNEEKFTSVDISNEGDKILTTSLGKSIRMWELIKK